MSSLYHSDRRIRKLRQPAALPPGHDRSGQVRIPKLGIRQPKTKLKPRRDAGAVKVAVVDEQALGEVGLGEGLVAERRRRVEQVAVVGLGARDRVGQAPCRVALAVEERGEGVA